MEKPEKKKTFLKQIVTAICLCLCAYKIHPGIKVN